MPRRLFLISPWVDLSPEFDGEDLGTLRSFLSAATLGRFAEMYIGNTTSVSDPMASPVHLPNATLARLPPTLLVYGDSERPRGQIKRLRDRLLTAGVALDTLVGHNEVHAYPMWHDVSLHRFLLFYQ